MLLVNATTCSWKKVVFEFALNECLQSFSLNFSSHLFSPDEYNRTNFPRQELNTANPCPILNPQNYLGHKICRKIVIKLKHSQLCILQKEKLDYYGFFDFGNSISYKLFLNCVESFEEWFINCFVRFPIIQLLCDRISRSVHYLVTVG